MSQTTYTLPPLPYDYDALEPYISKQIMELHHQKHHQTYVDNLNAALAKQAEAVEQHDIGAQLANQQAIKFNGGGHVNHSLFWQNLAPPKTAATKIEAAKGLQAAITARWGSFDAFQAAFTATLLGIQGSGWGWLVKHTTTGALAIVTTKDQDPVGAAEVPVFGVDMWEHAYYLQYLNNKGNYLQGIWRVINWETAEHRFQGDRGTALRVAQPSI